MPITVSSTFTAAGTSSPVVSTDLVIHLPEEIVEVASQAEREDTRLIVCCRTAEQAKALSDRLLGAAIGSALLSRMSTRQEVTSTVEAFELGDFTVLLVTDDLHNPWQVDGEVALLHADLPALHGPVQVMTTLNARRQHVQACVPI
ncbi:MAG: hypothetical protein ACK5MT_21705 [Actinomycetales bacterium]